ncbi:intraflagellar transport protein 27 homolog [Lates japonicus]|uniref:Intraflagellar transport protein 27 homolog n=1 Tax=Lates japonicus TaxID=270547 RepID=A0AAD3NPA3_LATJO|nr:intraflagellar transport protein 27 homolog [Lates japonicus]
MRRMVLRLLEEGDGSGSSAFQLRMPASPHGPPPLWTASSLDASSPPAAGARHRVCMSTGSKHRRNPRILLYYLCCCCGMDCTQGRVQAPVDAPPLSRLGRSTPSKNRLKNHVASTHCEFIKGRMLCRRFTAKVTLSYLPKGFPAPAPKMKTEKGREEQVDSIGLYIIDSAGKETLVEACRKMVSWWAISQTCLPAKGEEMENCDRPAQFSRAFSLFIKSAREIIRTFKSRAETPLHIHTP